MEAVVIKAQAQMLSKVVAEVMAATASFELVEDCSTACGRPCSTGATGFARAAELMSRVVQAIINFTTNSRFLFFRNCIRGVQGARGGILRQGTALNRKAHCRSSRRVRTGSSVIPIFRRSR